MSCITHRPNGLLRKAYSGLARLAGLAVLGCATFFNVHAGTGQLGPDPIALDPVLAKPIDNMAVLMAGAADRTGVDIWVIAPYKHFWAINFDSPADSLAWRVNVATATDFHVDALLTGNASEQFQLSVKETGARLNFSTSGSGWDKTAAGVIRLPAGTSTLVLSKPVSNSKSSVKSLELVRNSDYAAYRSRVASFKASTEWLRGAHGHMNSWGAWSYPKTGAGSDIQTMARQFDVARYVAEMKTAQVDYVVWSMTWWQYRMLAPIQTLDRVAGNSDYTADRDLVGEIAHALNDAGIRFFLYYHTGQGTSGSPWWAAQNFPSSYSATSVGDRSTFFNNWKAVVSEIGQRYGRALAGWWFDDGLVYYPANFEELGQAARAGNPERLIAYNSWQAARYTDFQDYYAGEGSTCRPAWPTDDKAVFSAGPYAGLFYQCSFVLEPGGDWGVWAPNQHAGATAPSVAAMQNLFTGRSPGSAMTMAALVWNGPEFVNGTAANMGAAAVATGNAFVKPAAPYQPKAVSVAADGELVVLQGGTGNTAPVLRNGASWKTLPGGLTQISVVGQNKLWGINSVGQLWYWNGSSWSQAAATGLTGTPVRISTGSDAAVYVLTLNADGQYRVWQRQGSGSWLQLSGSLKELSAVSQGEFWGLNAAGQLWHWVDGGWTQVSTSGAVQPVQLAAGSDGTLIILGADNSIWSRNAATGAWTRLPGGLMNVAVRHAGEVWGINSSGQLWRWSGTAWTQAL